MFSGVLQQRRSEDKELERNGGGGSGSGGGEPYLWPDLYCVNRIV